VLLQWYFTSQRWCRITLMIHTPLSLTHLTVWRLAGLQQPHRRKWEYHKHSQQPKVFLCRIPVPPQLSPVLDFETSSEYAGVPTVQTAVLLQWYFTSQRWCRITLMIRTSLRRRNTSATITWRLSTMTAVKTIAWAPSRYVCRHRT